MCTAECRLMECISTTTVDMNLVQQLVTVEGGNYYCTTIACRTVECGTGERDGGRYSLTDAYLVVRLCVSYALELKLIERLRKLPLGCGQI